MCYALEELHKWDDHKLSGHADYCCMDKMSRIEPTSMAKEMNFHVERCNFRWLDLRGKD